MFWIIVAPPAKDVFPFLVDLQSYPSQLFSLAMTVGLYSVRRQHRGETPIYKAWDAAIIFYAIVSVFLLVTPWLVPAGGIYGGDVSFLWCTYIIVGIGLIFICGAYYVVWMKILPRAFNYRYEVDVSVFSPYIIDLLTNTVYNHQTVTLQDGSVLNQLRRVKLE